MAKKLRDEDLNLNIIVNGDRAKKELGDLEKSTRDLINRNKELRAEKQKLERAGKEESARYKQITADMRENNAAIKSNEARMSELRKEIGITGLTMSQLRTEQTRLKRLMDSSTPGTQQWKQYRNELNSVEAQMKKVREGAKNTHLSISKMADGFNKYFGMLSVWAASVTGIIFSFKKASNAYAEFDDKVADVMKTTNLAKNEVMEMNEELRDVNTRTAQLELLNLGRIAGKLGFDDADEILGFIRAADQVVVALSEDLGGAEESIRDLGKLTDIFKIKDIYGIEEAMLKTGSAINELGMASTANEEYLVQFGKRTAGIAPQAGVSIQNILGLGATLDALGQGVEMSSTAYSKMMTTMAKKTTEFAKIAGMGIEEFKELMEKDANEAMIRVLEGINRTEGGFQQMVGTLGDLGIEGQRMTSVYGALANNTDMLRTQQELSNKAFEEGISLTNEFNIKNNTRQAQLEKARKNLSNITVELGRDLSPAVLVSTNAFTYFVKAMVALIRITREYYPLILSSASAITFYWGAVKIAANWTKIETAYKVTATAVEKAYAVTKKVLTGEIKLATIAQRAWNLVLKANPIGLVTGLIAGAITYLIAYSRKVREVTAAQKALNDVETRAQQNVAERKTQVELLIEAAKNEKLSLDDRKKALQELNKISPKYFGNLTLEKINTQAATKATDDYIKSLLKLARVQAAREALIDLEKERIAAVQDATDYEIKWYQTAWNGVKSFGNASAFAYNQAVTGAKNATKAEDEYMKKKQALIGVIKESTNISAIRTVVDDDYDDDDDEAGGGRSSSRIITAPTVKLSTPKNYDVEAEMRAKFLADQKANEKEWTRFLKDEIKKREDLKAHELKIETEIEQARQELQDMRINAIGQVAGTLSNMFEQGSAAQIALFALEKAFAIAEVYINLAREKSAIALAARKMDVTLPGSGIAWEAVMSTKAMAAAKINTGLIIAQTVAGIAGKGKKAGGFADTGSDDDIAGFYHANEWIASADLVRNPDVRKVIDVFEEAQRKGTQRTLDINAIMKSLAMPGVNIKKTGGYASVSSPVYAPPQPGENYRYPGTGLSEKAVTDLTVAINRLLKHKPVVAVELLKKKMEQYDDIMDQTGL